MSKIVPTIFFAFLFVFTLQGAAMAASVSLNPAAIGTVADWGVMGPPDGRPERITSTTQAAVQKFNPHLKGIVEFDLSGVSGVVDKATLNFTQGPDAEGEDVQVSISFYQGDGGIDLFDFSIPAEPAASFSSPVAKGPLAQTVDVTAAVRQAVEEGYRYIGFRFETLSQHRRDFAFGELSTFRLGTGRLEIEFSPER